MIIFDYATLASDKHRRHFIDQPHQRCFRSASHRDCVCVKCEAFMLWKPDYAAYYAAAKDDLIIDAGLEIHGRFWIGEKPRVVEIWCDLPETYRELICEWLFMNWYLGLFKHEEEVLRRTIRMRPDGDTTPWHEIKEKWIKKYLERNISLNLRDAGNYHFDMAFEPSGSPMIETWKQYGVTCLEVHDGKRK